MAAHLDLFEATFLILFGRSDAVFQKLMRAVASTDPDRRLMSQLAAEGLALIGAMDGIIKAMKLMKDRAGSSV